MSINAINFALASALMLMPPTYSVEQHQTPQINELELATQTDFEQIADWILAINGSLEMFYHLAYADVSVFDRFPAGELTARFAKTQQLLDESEAFRHQIKVLDDNLDLCRQNFQKLHRLYQSYEYKKEADRVLLSRVNSPSSIAFDKNSTDEEIRAFIFGGNA